MKLCIVLSVAIASIFNVVQSHPLTEQVWSAAYAYPTSRVTPFKIESTAIGTYDWPYRTYPLYYPETPFTFPYDETLGYYPMTEVIIEREDPDKKTEHKEEKIEEHKEEEEHNEEEHNEEEHNEEEHKEEEHKEEEHKEHEHKEDEHKHEDEHNEEEHKHDEEEKKEE